MNNQKLILKIFTNRDTVSSTRFWSQLPMWLPALTKI